MFLSLPVLFESYNHPRVSTMADKTDSNTMKVDSVSSTDNIERPPGRSFTLGGTEAETLKGSSTTSKEVDGHVDVSVSLRHSAPMLRLMSWY